MSDWSEMKMRDFFGPELGNVKKIDILCRTIEWLESETEYRADPKHAQILIEQLGLIPGFIARYLTGEHDAMEEDDEKLELDEARRLRALAARTNYLSLDRHPVRDQGGD